MGSPEIIQALARQIHAGKNTRCVVIVLAPAVQIPAELDKLFVCVDHELPDHSQLEEIARGVATQDGELPSGDELPRVIDAAKGLTRSEAENAYSLSLVRHGTLKAETLWEIKAGQLKKSGLVSLHRGTENFQQLGGLENLKAFCLRAMRRQGEGIVSNQPRGVLLLSPPGCGKSQFAKALGNETGRPTVVLDIGNLLGSLVGQSESNVRAPLKLADASCPWKKSSMPLWNRRQSTRSTAGHAPIEGPVGVARVPHRRIQLFLEKALPGLFPLCRPVETPRISTVGRHRLQRYCA